MGPREQIERAMDRLEDDYSKGNITYEEFREEMKLLQAEYRDAAAEAAQGEYDRWFD